MASVWGGGLIHFPHVLLEMSRSTEAKPKVPRKAIVAEVGLVASEATVMKLLKIRAQTASELQRGFD